jgi:hypothetical protein
VPYRKSCACVCAWRSSKIIGLEARPLLGRGSGSFNPASMRSHATAQHVAGLARDLTEPSRFQFTINDLPSRNELLMKPWIETKAVGAFPSRPSVVRLMIGGGKQVFFHPAYDGSRLDSKMVAKALDDFGVALGINPAQHQPPRLETDHPAHMFSAALLSMPSPHQPFRYGLSRLATGRQIPGLGTCAPMPIASRQQGRKQRTGPHLRNPEPANSRSPRRHSDRSGTPSLHE